MSVIDDIKDRIDILEVVSETVKLKKSGRTYIGFCPFHANTRTPSFVVWPETGTWKCFGACNTGGDVFTFLMKRDGLEFKDALRELGRRTGIEVEERKPEGEIEDQHLARLREAVAAAAQWFNYLLLNNPQAQIARDHLAQRGLTAQTIEAFQLGYALESWDGLHNHLLSKNFSNEEMIDAGLLVQRDDGRVFDRFRNRVMIPIHDGKGRPIGFGARALREGDDPKYLNSPQTVLFDKSRTLYALHAARQAIRDQKVAVIVEGYMDALAAHQYGFHNVVASLGTALTETQFKTTEEQFAQLRRIAKKVVLALDPDTAGINAMLRGLEVARKSESLDREKIPIFSPRGFVGLEAKLQIAIHVLTLPNDQDPDEIISTDPNQWRSLVEQAPPILEFVIEKISAEHNLEDPKEKAAIAKEVLPIIRDVADPVEQTVYIQQLARRLRVDERAMFDQMRVASAASGKSKARATPSVEPVKRDVADLERYCLSLLVRHPYELAVIDGALDRANLPPLNVDDFEHAANREVFRAFRAALAMDAAPTAVEIQAELDTALYDYFTALSEDLLGQVTPAREHIDQDAQQAGLRLRERRLRREGHELHALLQDAQSDATLTDIDTLYQARQANAAALLRLQQILTARTITRTSDLWSRS